MTSAASSPTRRHRDSGSAIVASITMLLTLVGGALIWLTWNVDRSINASSDADAIAFQSARAGAQALDPASLRTNTPTLNSDTATQYATATAQTLLDANHTTGRVVSVVVGADRVTVRIEISEAGLTTSGQATVRIAVGVTGEGT